MGIYRKKMTLCISDDVELVVDLVPLLNIYGAREYLEKRELLFYNSIIDGTKEKMKEVEIKCKGSR